MAERGDKLFRLFVRRHSACGMSGVQINPLLVPMPETVPQALSKAYDCLPRFCKKLLPLRKEPIFRFMSKVVPKLFPAYQRRSREPNNFNNADNLLFWSSRPSLRGCEAEEKWRADKLFITKSCVFPALPKRKITLHKRFFFVEQRTI